MSQAIPFRKMNGLGNDFVVIDAREFPVRLTRDQVRRIADRQTGIGCDQLIIMEPSRESDTDVFMRIYNAEGGEVDACGNATRCIADIVMNEKGEEEVAIVTNAGILMAERADEPGMITIDMGRPKFRWDQIPLAEEFDNTRMIDVKIGPMEAPILHSPSAVNMGNPHAIFWVDDLDAYDLSRSGPLLENHPMFPEGANISLAQVTAPDAITIKVWERGAGLTLACGTAACAVGVAAYRKGLTEDVVTVTLPGGPLIIECREEDGHVLMTGPYTYDYEGVVGPELLAGAA